MTVEETDKIALKAFGRNGEYPLDELGVFGMTKGRVRPSRNLCRVACHEGQVLYLNRGLRTVSYSA